MRIFILLGHTDAETLSGAFADCYEAYARTAGHELRRQDIGDMEFDPVLHKGYKVIQECEPDIRSFQENMKWAEHVVIIYPTWWGTLPAKLKGLFDRAWLPHFAFTFADHGLTWTKLLKGRTARIITSSNTNPWILRFMYGSPTNLLALNILRFAGIRARAVDFGPSERASERKKAKWFRKVARLAQQGR